MVVDAEWDFLEPRQEKEFFSAPGYTEVKSGTFVSDEDAYSYAMERCLSGAEEDKKEFQAMLVEWFYSGGAWRREEGC